MRHQELRDAMESGTLLMHGCSLDNLANILMDDALLSGLRGHDGPVGVSLTRSLAIATQFCRTHEAAFDEVLQGWYDAADERCRSPRKGAILVFAREELHDLDLVPFRDIESYDEHEERVVGDVDAVLSRLSAIVVHEADLRWFRSVVDRLFRAMSEPADELLAALDRAEKKFVFHHQLDPEEPPRGGEIVTLPEEEESLAAVP